MPGGLAAYLQELRLSCLQPPGEVEPDVDQRDLGLDDAAKFREEEDLKAGAVMKGTLEPGEGEERPQEGDLVFLHYSVMSEHKDVLASTDAAHGGSGHPQPFVLGKGRRMLRGMELGVMEMARGERALLDIQPSYAFLHKDSGLPLPEGLRREAPVVVDVTLTSWLPGASVRCVGTASDVFLRTLQPGKGWETPRPPFEVQLHLEARDASTTGRPGEGQPYFSTSSGEPLACTLGAGQLPPGVEAALQAMQRQQEAVAYCPTSQLRGGSLVPDPPGQEASSSGRAAEDYAEFKLQLLEFSQVRDMTGDGGVVKRIARKGEGEFPLDCPLEDSRVRLHYRLKAEGSSDWLLDSRGADGQAAPLEFETGMGEMPEALDMCARLMLRGELAVVTATWRYAFDGRDDAPQGLPAGGRVQFEVELLGFEREANEHQLAGPAKLERCSKLKEQGNTLFKQGKTRLARAKYGRALKVVERAMDLETEEQVAEASRLKASCLLNMARCAEREQEWGEARSWCTKAINEDDGYAKAYFRRAVVAAHLGDEQAAQDDLALCAAIDPSTADECERELRRMEKRTAAAQAKQAAAMKGFLDARR